jgi:hypothetical protein
MLRHYSPDPAFLKPLADIAFADGANRLVWHTFTCSPKKFGVPGAEYFAGTHINRNVTWHKEAGAFIKYLTRCQAMLQRGETVDDGEFVDLSTNYYHWGRYRKNEVAQFTTAHRREGNIDWFFVAGEGKGDVILNAPLEGRRVEIWDAVSVRRTAALASEAVGGKTRVRLDLPTGGSAFAVFLSDGALRSDRLNDGAAMRQIPLEGEWRVSFSYHDGITAMPPAPVVMPALRDWTTYGKEGEAASTSLRYFSGTAVYRTTVNIPSAERCKLSAYDFYLSLGALKSGIAHVYVNGMDCSVVWCAPWKTDISVALREGKNEIEIRYTNNWYNRLVGDCFLKKEDRVTRSTLQYWKLKRLRRNPKKPWLILPTVYSGPSVYDSLQPSGLSSPVVIEQYERE